MTSIDTTFLDPPAAHPTNNGVPNNRMYLNVVFGLVLACRSSPWLINVRNVKIETVSLFSCFPVCSFCISGVYVFSQLRETLCLRCQMFIHKFFKKWHFSPQ